MSCSGLRILNASCDSDSPSSPASDTTNYFFKDAAASRSSCESFSNSSALYSPGVVEPSRDACIAGFVCEILAGSNLSSKFYIACFCLSRACYWILLSARYAASGSSEIAMFTMELVLSSISSWLEPRPLSFSSSLPNVS